MTRQVRDDVNFFLARVNTFHRHFDNLFPVTSLIHRHLGFSVQSQSGEMRSRRVAIAFGASVGSVAVVVIIFGMLLWWHRRHNQQVFYDVNGEIMLCSSLSFSSPPKFQHSFVIWPFLTTLLLYLNCCSEPINYVLCIYMQLFFLLNWRHVFVDHSHHFSCQLFTLELILFNTSAAYEPRSYIYYIYIYSKYKRQE